MKAYAPLIAAAGLFIAGSAHASYVYTGEEEPYGGGYPIWATGLGATTTGWYLLQWELSVPAEVTFYETSRSQWDQYEHDWTYTGNGNDYPDYILQWGPVPKSSRGQLRFYVPRPVIQRAVHDSLPGLPGFYEVTTYTTGYYQLDLLPDVEQTIQYKLTVTYMGPVPEPATWALMIAGFGVVGAAMRRRERTLRHESL